MSVVLSESILTKTNRIFDRAFDIKIDDRWQSIPALKQDLIDILESENQKYNKTETVVDKIRNQLSASSSHSEQRELFHRLVKQTIELIPDVVQDLVNELNYNFGSGFEIEISRGAGDIYYRFIDWENFKFSISNTVRINYKFAKEIFLPSFQAYITGNEFIFVSNFKEKEVELLRTYFSDEADFTGFSERLKKFYYEDVESILS